MKTLLLYLALVLGMSITGAQASPLHQLASIDRSDIASTARAFFPDKPMGFRLKKITRAGDYAVVSYLKGRIESTAGDGQLLLQRFHFGWQIIDLGAESGLTTPELLSFGISAKKGALLLQGVVSSTATAEACRGIDRVCNADSGAAADIEEVRAFFLSWKTEAIGPVIVRSGYAIAGWWGFGGGEVIFKKSNGSWHKIAGGGGAFCLRDLVQLKIPESVARQLLSARYHCG